MSPYQYSSGLILTAVFITGLYWITGNLHKKPTPDQLYGCTIAQQASNGDCP